MTIIERLQQIVDEEVPESSAETARDAIAEITRLTEQLAAVPEQVRLACKAFEEKHTERIRSEARAQALGEAAVVARDLRDAHYKAWNDATKPDDERREQAMMRACSAVAKAIAVLASPSPATTEEAT